MTQSYPLQWPQGWPRTPLSKRTKSAFKVTQDVAQRELLWEIQRLGGRNWIISTNVPLRRDGMPYADADRRNIVDRGVAVYFTLKGEQKCFACDRWETIKDNMRAIQKTIEALRGIERWGSSQMVEQAFRGFTPLPPPAGSSTRRWHSVLDVAPESPIEACEAAYRAKARSMHPDNGGSHGAMAELNAAIAEARRLKTAAA